METPAQPEVPEFAQQVWEWWWELNARRPPGFDALAPLSYTEIRSWILLTGKLISPEEIRWLIQMDDSWLYTVSTEQKARREREQEKADMKKQGSGR